MFFVDQWYKIPKVYFCFIILKAAEVNRKLLCDLSFPKGLLELLILALVTVNFIHESTLCPLLCDQCSGKNHS